MGKTKKYWKSPEELIGDEQFIKAQENEFPTEMSIDEFLGSDSVEKSGTNRRDFLKFLGFSLGAATLASCETPVIKSIPYVNKPEEITPGVANWYASTYYDGVDFANVLVKTREGRPIFIKGNKTKAVVTGAVNARINSSVISLYNDSRLRTPMHQGVQKSWSAIDESVTSMLAGLGASSNVRVLTNSIISPSTKAALNSFIGNIAGGSATVSDSSVGFGGASANSEGIHVTYDPISHSGMRKANKANFGVDGIANYDFSKAMTIVSIGADFLANWLMSNKYAADYAVNRKPEGTMSKHYQFETIMSVTGSNADVRVPIRPSQEGAVAVALCKALGGSASGPAIEDGMVQRMVEKAAADLKAQQGKALVVSGSNDMNIQSVVNKINELLGSYGSTIDLNNPLTIKQGDDQAVDQLITDVVGGKVDALFIYGVNPVYSHPRGMELAAALKSGNVQSVSMSMFNDETAQCCTYVAPDHHWLEAWNDYEVVKGTYSLAQPTINPLFETRHAAESFLRWSGNDTDFLSHMKNTWSSANGVGFANWNQAVHDGGIKTSMNSGGSKSHSGSNLTVEAMPAGGNYEVVFYQNTGMGDGTHANNPFLQELPDPVTKVTWDNYITMNPKDCEANGFKLLIAQERPASLATITVNGKEVTMPVYPTPGQRIGTIGVALGYGRFAGADHIGGAAYQHGRYGDPELDGEAHQSVGTNVYPMLAMANGTLAYNGVANLTDAAGTYNLACTQTHHTMMGRTSVVRDTYIDTYKNGTRDDYNPPHLLPMHEHGTTVHTPVKDIDLWDDHPVEKIGHRWGLAIDLNSCIGCGSCVTACNLENNIPVVGKDEVWRARDMHWMRIDRYFSSDQDSEHKRWKETGEGDFTYAELEVPSEYPDVTFVPLMCQHCNHAPCETVCPVAATTHSNEGLNQMTYNRCIGTRYCANNCPFKVRRFNWFNYVDYHKFSAFNPAHSELGRMVLNPDVVVRSRGVMEKCSLCVQQIQAGKLEAKKAGTPVQDGSIQSACASACPTNAITFGDYNDTDSQITKQNESDRAYYMLEEVGVQPNITYMVKVRNTEAGTSPAAPSTETAEA